MDNHIIQHDAGGAPKEARLNDGHFDAKLLRLQPHDVRKRLDTVLADAVGGAVGKWHYSSYTGHIYNATCKQQIGNLENSLHPAIWKAMFTMQPGSIFVCVCGFFFQPQEISKLCVFTLKQKRSCGGRY